MKKVCLLLVFVLCGALSFVYGGGGVNLRMPRVEQALFDSMQERLTQEAIRLRRELQQSNDKIQALTSSLEERDTQIVQLQHETKALRDVAAVRPVSASQEMAEGQAKQELRDQLAKTIQALESQQAASKQQQQLITSLTTQTKQLTDVRDACQIDLVTERTKTTRTAKLEQDLLDSRNELMLCKTELSSVSTDAAVRLEAAVVRQSTPARQQPTAPENTNAAGRTAVQAVAPVAMQPTSAMIIEVLSDKANLRNGPGAQQGILMDVPKGVRLTVEEKRGGWYRVLAPTGERAYIDENVVRIVSGAPVAAPVVAAATVPAATDNTVRGQLRKPRDASRKKTPPPVVVTPDSDLEMFGEVDDTPAGGSVQPIDTEAAAYKSIKKALIRK